MKKLFFAAIAVMVMVSVSSVFANSAKSEMGLVMATDQLLDFQSKSNLERVIPINILSCPRKS